MSWFTSWLHSSRFPLRSKAAFLAAVGAVVSIATTWGLSAADAERWTITGTNIATLLALFGVFVASGEQDVTPMEDPRDEDGTPLVRSDGTPALRSFASTRLDVPRNGTTAPPTSAMARIRTSTRMRYEHGGAATATTLAVSAAVGAVVVVQTVAGVGAADALPLLGVAGLALRS